MYNKTAQLQMKRTNLPIEFRNAQAWVEFYDECFKILFDSFPNNVWDDTDLERFMQEWKADSMDAIGIFDVEDYDQWETEFVSRHWIVLQEIGVYSADDAIEKGINRILECVA